MHHYTTITDADLPEVFRVMRLAFTGEEPGQRQWLATMGIDNLRAMRPARDAKPDAVVSLVRMGQHFGGRIVPMTGIVGVAVAPECRGGGVAQQMMAGALREAREAGTPISTLYASTQSLYRKAGYEQAGSRFKITIRPDQIGVRERALHVRPITNDDADAVIDCARRFASHYDGTLVREGEAGGRGWDAYCWQRVRENRETRFTGFAAECPDDGSRINGYLFMHQGRSPHRGRQSLALSDLAFTTPEAGRRLLAFLSDYAMIADEASFFGSPTHPILSLMPLQKYQVEHFDYWMMRITDLPKALEARGYLPGVRASIDLEVTDAIIPENAGAWRIEVEGGSARVTKGKSGGSRGAFIRCDIRALASLYSGFTTPAQARLLGWIEGDDQAVKAASSIFPGSTPWMNDMF